MNNKFKSIELSQEEIKNLVIKILEKNPEYNESYEFSEYDDDNLHIPLGKYIKEDYEYTETVDYDYIYRDYTCEIFGDIYTIRGSSYRKDQSICDEEMSEEIFKLEKIILSEKDKKNNLIKKIKSYEDKLFKLKNELNKLN